ncbi:hypothetical protein GCM10028828_18390 [Corynebacterium tapiri]
MSKKEARIAQRARLAEARGATANGAIIVSTAPRAEGTIAPATKTATNAATPSTGINSADAKVPTSPTVTIYPAITVCPEIPATAIATIMRIA